MLGLHFLLNRYMALHFRYRGWLENDSARPWYATIGLMFINFVGTFYLAEQEGGTAVQILKATVGLIAAGLLIPFFWVTGRELLRGLAQLSDRYNRRR